MSSSRLPSTAASWVHLVFKYTPIPPCHELHSIQFNYREYNSNFEQNESLLLGLSSNDGVDDDDDDGSMCVLCSVYLLSSRF